LGYLPLKLNKLLIASLRAHLVRHRGNDFIICIVIGLLLSGQEAGSTQLKPADKSVAPLGGTLPCLFTLLGSAAFLVACISEKSGFLGALATRGTEFVLNYNFFHQIRDGVRRIALCGRKIESPRFPILISRVKNLAEQLDQLHSSHMLTVNSGVLPLSPSGLDFGDPLRNVRRIKGFSIDKVGVLRNGIRDTCIIVLQGDSMKTHVPKRHPRCHPLGGGPVGSSKEKTSGDRPTRQDGP